MSEITTFQI